MSRTFPGNVRYLSGHFRHISGKIRKQTGNFRKKNPDISAKKKGEFINRTCGLCVLVFVVFDHDLLLLVLGFLCQGRPDSNRGLIGQDARLTQGIAGDELWRQARRVAQHWPRRFRKRHGSRANGFAAYQSPGAAPGGWKSVFQKRAVRHQVEIGLSPRDGEEFLVQAYMSTDSWDDAWDESRCVPSRDGHAVSEKGRK